MLVNQYHKPPTVWCFITPIYGEVGGGLGFLLTLLLYQHNMCEINISLQLQTPSETIFGVDFLGCHTPSQMVFGAPRCIYISLSLHPHQSTNLSIYYLSISFYIVYLFLFWSVLIHSYEDLLQPAPGHIDTIPGDGGTAATCRARWHDSCAFTASSVQAGVERREGAICRGV
jgi:hypothetical protein